MRLADFVFSCTALLPSNGERATGFLILAPMAESFAKPYWRQIWLISRDFVKENSACSFVAY